MKTLNIVKISIIQHYYTNQSKYTTNQHSNRRFGELGVSVLMFILKSKKLRLAKALLKGSVENIST